MMNQTGRYEHLAAFALEHPWAITSSMATILTNILARRLAGEKADATEIAAAVTARAARSSAAGGVATAHGLAVIPVHGVIAPRMNMLTHASGGTSFEELGATLAAAVADPNIKAVVFDVDSPGGSVAGAREFARQVQQAARKKPIIAHAHHLMASAAFWAMSGASEIVASPSALVGSIGVLSIHDDLTQALEKLGVKREIIAAGRFKHEAAPGASLSPAAREHVQALVDTTYGRMVADIAQGRRVATGTVERNYGQGRVLDAEHALEAGMVDRIEPVETTVSRALGVTPTPVAALADATQMAAHRDALARARMMSLAAQLEAAEGRQPH